MTPMPKNELETIADGGGCAERSWEHVAMLMRCLRSRDGKPSSITATSSFITTRARAWTSAGCRIEQARSETRVWRVF